ncbi:MAG: hypothetical protein ABR541_09000 [Candidatus Dormibacteria bacterium]
MRASRALVYATAAALPAYLLRLRVGGLQITLLEVLWAITVVVFAVEARVLNVRPRWPGAYTAPMLAIAGAIAASVAASAAWRSDLAAARTLFLEPALFLGLACSVIETDRHLRRLVGALFLGGGLLAAADLVAVAWTVMAHPAAALAPPIARIALGDGFFLVPLCGVALALLVGGQGLPPRPRKLPPAVFLAVALPAVALSLTRAAWLILGAAALGVALAHVGKRLVLCAVIVGVSVALLLAPIHSPLGETSVRDSQTAVLSLWNQTAGGAAGTALDAHRILGVPLAVIIGLLGLGGFTWLAVRALRWLLATAGASQRERRALAIGAAVAMGAVLLRGLLQNRLLGDDLGMVAAFGGLILASVARLERIRLPALVRLPRVADDIEPAELPMPADIPRRTGRHPVGQGEAGEPPLRGELVGGEAGARVPTVSAGRR